MHKYLLLLLALPLLPACTARPSAVEAEPPVQVEQVSPEAVVLAALDGRIEVIEQALAAGYKVDFRNKEGRTALMFAAFNGHNGVVKRLLLAGADVNIQDQSGSTALMLASSGPFPETVQLLLDRGAVIDTADRNEHFTALMWAAAEGQIDVVKLLLNHKADFTLTDVDGDTAESFAARNGHTAIAKNLQAAAPKNPDSKQSEE